TKVDANTQSIKNLESELSRAIESFSKSNDEKDILHRLRALEEKVKPSIEAYGYHDKKIKELEERIKGLEEERENFIELIKNHKKIQELEELIKSLEEECKNSSQLFKNLFDHNAELHEQMNSLSVAITTLQSQQPTSGEDKSGKSWWPGRNGKKKKIPVQDSDHKSSTIGDKATRSDKATPTSLSQAESDYTSPTSLKRTFSVHDKQKASRNNESPTFKRGHKRASSTGDLLATVDKGAEEHETLKEPLSSSRAALNKI
ncbi:PREDICTED: myosin heavy chain, clone 203-like, partial [Amphimedon queenslandica]|uniref:Uncharacterized protein n=2 Tax=Amphimedon queenslandica TaxID=400682 RepID=A0AAN0ISW3_AMPQE